MVRPRLLDLFSCAGGAAMGYHQAGFQVVGVDIAPQPRYPFEHHVADALEFLAEHGHEFDAIHASPPCQRYSLATNMHDRSIHPDLIEPVRDALDALGKPYIIENVPGSPLKNYVTLCGSEFNLIARDADGTLLQLRRHRWFESNVWLMGAGGCRHDHRMRTATVMGNGGTTEAVTRVTDDRRRGGYVPELRVCQDLMGIDWMRKRELSESIPPAYTKYLGEQLILSV